MPSQLSSLRNFALPGLARIVQRPPSGDPKTTLVIQPDHLGDILLTQPAVTALRAALPDHRLVAVVGPWSREITELAWPVDQIVTVSFPGFDRAGATSRIDPYLLLKRTSGALRRLNAGNAVVLRPDAWWAACLARMSVSGEIAGSSDPRVTPFLDNIAETSPDDHVTDRAMQIVAAFAPEIQDRAIATSPKLERPPDGEADDLLRSFGVSRSYVVAHPGSGAPVKHWPVPAWRALLSRMSEQRIVVTGTPGERPMCETIARDLEHVSCVAGETTLRELLAILAHAEYVIGTDNGPMHLAVALDTPTVHLYGPSSIDEFGPRGDRERHRVVSAGWTCPQCRNLDPARPAGCGCMLAITPDDVLSQVHRLSQPGAPDATRH